MNLIHGDCIEAMGAMEPESVDAIVTDPPYGLEFMGKEWDRLGATVEHPDDGEGPWGRTRRVRFGSNATTMQAWHQQWAAAAYRVAKPSAYLLAFGGTRTVHRMTCALEDAGWIIRDMLVWAYASGFPKSKASLKPAWEPIVMARKPGPLRMLDIDGCRIPMADHDRAEAEGKNQHTGYANPGSNRDSYSGSMPPRTDYDGSAGRWPANVILTDPIFDGGWEGVVGGGEARSSGEYEAVMRGERSGPASIPLDNGPQYSDSGTYSRFFLIPKADRADREPVLGGLPMKRVHPPRDDGRQWDIPGSHSKDRGNNHPTVKPTDLMRHLVRLVIPTGGTVLDPFLGSGTTALAAEMEGFPWIGIEREAEYIAIAEARLNGVQRGLGLELVG